MRENDSDSGEGWQQPSGYVSPWAPRDEGDAAPAAGPAPGPAANAASPLENDVPDTISFGSSRREAGPDGYGQPSYGQSGSGQPSYGESGYGQPSSARGTGRARAAGDGQTRSGGYGAEGYEPGGYGSGNAGGWGEPGPVPPPRRRGRRLGVYIAVAALAASVGATA